MAIIVPGISKRMCAANEVLFFEKKLKAYIGFPTIGHTIFRYPIYVCIVNTRQDLYYIQIHFICHLHCM